MLDFGTKNEVVLVYNKQNISSERGVCVCKITWLQPRIHTRLRESLNILQEEESQINPFENITDSDVEDACGPFHLIDSDQESEEEIDV